MKFDDLDTKMRVYETYLDTCIPPEVYMVARLDGRGFTRLTKEVCNFQAPFDDEFRNLMTSTAESLMKIGFRVVYAYTESDEISLLFDLNETLFGRKIRKYNSILAAQASSFFSLQIGQVLNFDCRISQLPNQDLVIDYFRWRNEDASRNALNSWCYWTLRKEGFNQKSATQEIHGLSVSQKNELLFQYGINFNDLPQWQKRGIGLYWEDYEQTSMNPITNECVMAIRKQIKIDYNLPIKDDYGKFIRTQLL